MELQQTQRLFFGLHLCLAGKFSETTVPDCQEPRAMEFGPVQHKTTLINKTSLTGCTCTPKARCKTKTDFTCNEAGSPRKNVS